MTQIGIFDFLRIHFTLSLHRKEKNTIHSSTIEPQVMGAVIITLKGGKYHALQKGIDVT